MMRPKMGQQLRWYLLRREHPLKQESSVKTLRAAGRAAGMGCKGKAGAEARRGPAAQWMGTSKRGQGQGSQWSVKGATPDSAHACYVTHIPSPMLLITGKHRVSPAGKVYDCSRSRSPWHPLFFFPFFSPTCARLSCPSLSSRVYPNPCPSSR